MEGGRSILGFPAWLGACRGRVLACGLLATSAVIGASPVWADDSALLRSLAQRFDSPAKVFTEDENAVSLSQTAEPRRMYVRQVDQPPALGLEIVPPTVIPIKVMTVPRVVVASPPSLGLTMDPPKVIPQRIVMPAVDPPPLALGVGEPPVPVPPPIVAAPAAGYARYEEPEPLQIGGLTLTSADQPPPAPRPLPRVPARREDRGRLPQSKSWEMPRRAIHSRSYANKPSCSSPASTSSTGACLTVCSTRPSPCRSSITPGRLSAWPMSASVCDS